MCIKNSNVIITQDKLNQYEVVRQLGLYNMLDVKAISLTRFIKTRVYSHYKKLFYINEYISKYKKRYTGKIKTAK